MDRGSFDDFVATRSTRLLRTAYLLTHDRALAEDLVQTSLAKAWFAWGRIDGQPDAYVRRVMVNTYSSWWRRRWALASERGPGVDRPERTTERTPGVETGLRSGRSAQRRDSGGGP
ncbi:sigma factor [Terrabacter sp. Root181]|uniref:sigma factor n=1 Tax=Terrabacter sp. Root181 TaxID=1736484 RepID=UPI001F23CAA8|nr:sigma factor [Terrabacter sp. Root181]